MTEKGLLKSILLKFVIILLVILGAHLAIDFASKSSFTDYIDLYISNDKNLTADDLEVSFDNPSILSGEIISIDTTTENMNVVVQLKAQSSGNAFMYFTNRTTGEEINSIYYHVSRTHTITNLNTGNFTSHRLHTLFTIVFLLAILVLLMYGFIQCRKVLGYSYQSIFYIGFFFWILLITIITSLQYITYSDMSEIYTDIQSAGVNFMFCSAPFILIFAILMSVSNISLIRHERFRMQNALGIGISLAMVIGLIIGLFFYAMDLNTSEFNAELFYMVLSVYTSIYCLMECFLLGSIICGYLSARHEPAMDKDYIIILGCRVKKDGTLYPLIKGRVDRAIRFYEKQLAATGKKAIFVPSGGQGSDEQISEGDAMYRYLREQGYGDEQIIVENKSKNTKENMLFSKKLIEEDYAKKESHTSEKSSSPRIAFSTTNFHVFRSGIISRQNHFMPDGMGSATRWYFWPNAYVREMIGMITYLWKRLVIIMIPLVLFNAIVQFVF